MLASNSQIKKGQKMDIRKLADGEQEDPETRRPSSTVPTSIHAKIVAQTHGGIIVHQMWKRPKEAKHREKSQKEVPCGQLSLPSPRLAVVHIGFSGKDRDNIKGHRCERDYPVFVEEPD